MVLKHLLPIPSVLFGLLVLLQLSKADYDLKVESISYPTSLLAEVTISYDASGSSSGSSSSSSDSGDFDVATVCAEWESNGATYEYCSS